MRVTHQYHHHQPQSTKGNKFKNSITETNSHIFQKLIQQKN
jgi:hypothetical protein